METKPIEIDHVGYGQDLIGPGAVILPCNHHGEKGPRLSGWPIDKGVSWLQTREPRLARKLERRSDTRLVAFGVADGYVRIFQLRRPPAFVKRLIARYAAANARFFDLDGRDNARNGGAE